MTTELQPIIDYYLGYFSAHGEEAIKVICSLSVPVEILCMKYKTIIPIPNEQKEELRLYSKELFPDKTDEEIEKTMKVIYTIGTLL